MQDSNLLPSAVLAAALPEELTARMPPRLAAIVLVVARMAEIFRHGDVYG